MNRMNWDNVGVSLLLGGIGAILIGYVGKVGEMIPKTILFKFFNRIYQYLIWAVPINIPNLLLTIGAWLLILSLLILCIRMLVLKIRREW